MASMQCSVAATRLKVGLEAEVGHMMGPVTLQFLMEKPVDSVTTRLKVGTWSRLKLAQKISILEIHTCPFSSVHLILVRPRPLLRRPLSLSTSQVCHSIPSKHIYYYKVPLAIH